MHSLHAALSSAALLALVLIPVALFLAQRMRPLVCAPEAHLYLCAAALPPALAACWLSLAPGPWLPLAALAVMQIYSVRLAVLALHRLFLQRIPLPDVPEMPMPRDLQRVEGGVFPLPDVPELPTPADLAHAPEVSHA